MDQDLPLQKLRAAGRLFDAFDDLPIAAALVAVLALMSLWLLRYPLATLFVHIPLSYNEGWNAVHAARLMTGGPLYPPVSTGTTINYPPLSFYVVGFLGRLVGDPIFAGRIVSLVSLAVVTVNVGLVAAHLRAGRLPAILAAVTFVLFVQIQFVAYMGSDDPEWLGHALQTTALVMLVRLDRPPRPGEMAAMMVLLLMGGLVKQSLLVLPIVFTIWIGVQSRKALWAWVLICGTGLAVAAIACWLAYGAPFYEQVLGNKRSFTTDGLAHTWENFARYLAPVALFSVAGLVMARCRFASRLIGLYLAVSVIGAVMLMSARGVFYNPLFDCLAAAMPATALFVRELRARLTGTSLRRWAMVTPVFLIGLPYLLLAPRLDGRYGELRYDLANQSRWQQAIDTIAAAKGPVLCEELALCYWAGRASPVEFFNFGQRAIRHPELARALADRIRSKDFALVQQNSILYTGRLPAIVDAALLKSYWPVEIEPTALLRPLRDGAIR